jgi:DNA polymerase
MKPTTPKLSTSVKPSLNIDIETSAPIPVTKVGAFKYAEQPGLQVLCMAWKLGAGPIRLWDVFGGESIPAQVLDHVSDGGLIKAFNAGFEMSVLSNHAGQSIGWPRTKVSQWRDTAAKVASHGLPRSLGNAAIALPGIPRKDEAGKKVMLALSKPAGLAKATPEQLTILHDYCKNDVLVEYSIDQVLPKLPDMEQQLWELDYLINKRGILVDLPLVRQIAALIEKYTSSKIARCIELTGARPSQRKVVMAWCEDQGYTLDGYTADDVAEALTDTDCPAQVKEVLQIRQATAFAAVKKYAAFENGACADGRLRGMFLYHGAATGRWCIAEGSLVRVKRSDGLVTDIPIETVLLSDKVWDGDNWVAHEGLVFQGDKDVIEWDSVVATADHVVWTDEDTKMPLSEAKAKGVQLWSGSIT